MQTPSSRSVRPSLWRRVATAGLVMSAATLAGFGACSQVQQTEGQIVQRSLRGVVYVVGNEPFIRLALQDSAGVIHTVQGPKELENVLYQRQGKEVVVTVVGTEQQSEGPVVQFNGVVFPASRAVGPADSTGR